MVWSGNDVFMSLVQNQSVRKAVLYAQNLLKDDAHPLFGTVLLAAGAFTVFWPLIKAALIGVSLALPPTDLRKYGAGQGAWVIVTGSTGAIGEEWAKQLAAKGFNILLVSRNEGKLKTQADALRKVHKDVKIDYYSIDIGAAEQDAWDAFQKRIADLKIGVLINNAGLAEHVPNPFTDNSWKDHEAILRLNILGTVKITHIVSKQLVKAKKGIIINVSSFTGYAPAPGVALYSMTKAALHSFSTVLGHELRKTGVDVMCLQAHFIISTINGLTKPSFLVPLPSTYVASVLRHFGRKGGALFEPPYITDTYPGHAFEHWMCSTLTPWKMLLFAEEKVFADMLTSAIKEGTRTAPSGKDGK